MPRFNSSCELSGEDLNPVCWVCWRLIFFFFSVLFFVPLQVKHLKFLKWAKFVHDELHQNDFHCVLCMCQIIENSALLWVFFLLLFVVFGRKFLLKKQNHFSMYTLHSIMSASSKFFSEVVYSATYRHTLWNTDVLKVCNICSKYFVTVYI